MYQESSPLSELKQLFLNQNPGGEVTEDVEELYNITQSSETFWWMGLFETTDLYQDHRWIVYIERQSYYRAEEVRNVTRSFANLAAHLYPNIGMDLFFTTIQPEQDYDQLIQGCLRTIRFHHGGNNPNWPVQLLWQCRFEKG